MRTPRTTIALLGLGLLLAAGCGESSARSGSDAPRVRNLVVFVLDAARADHFGVYGHGRATTPRVDRFAADATVFRRVRAEASYTFLSTSALFTGASPAETGLGARSGGIVPDSMELLAERARAAGYRTYGYSENPYVTADFGLSQGFDVFDEAYSIEDHVALEPMSPDVDPAARLETLIRRAATGGDGPFFAYAHVLRPHNPYLPPAPFLGRFGSAERDRQFGENEKLTQLNAHGAPFAHATLERMRTLYDENLAYGDALFGEVLDALDAHAVAEDTVVVLVSDHGEAFGEHGAILHGTRLDDATLHVPLVIRVPGVAAGEVSSPVQLADLGAALGRFVEGEPARALPRLAEARDPSRPLLSWTFPRVGRIAAWTPERRVVLDARTGRVVVHEDPSGRALEPDERGRALRRVLDVALAGWAGTARDVSAAPPEIAPARRAQLRALGYAEP